MSDLLASASEALGIPETLVQRSAAARAAESGSTVEDVLAAWSGGEAVAAQPTPDANATAAAPPVATPPAEAAPPPPPPVAEVAPPPLVKAGPAPVPDEVTAAQAATLPEVVTVPTAGIRERTSFRLPTWLTTLMLIIPAFALFGLGGAATGECGDATELAVDPVSGQIVNCDGSEFTGSGIGGGSVDFVALGGDIYSGAEIAAVNCAGCHGAGGGGGVGPAMGAVINVFGSCTDHIEWVSLGSTGFQAAGRNSYGDTNKPVNGGMPGFASTLSEEQLAAVVAYERVQFAGGDAEEVLADCGLAGDEPSEGEEPTDGAVTTTTAPPTEARAGVTN